MKTHIIAITIVAAAAVGLGFGCGKKDGEAGGGGGEGSEAAAKPAPLEYKPIKWMGLKVEVPGNAEIFDSSADAPNANVSAGECSVMINTVTAAYGDFEASVKEADKGVGNKAEKWIKKEKTADGFHLEFEGKDMMDEPVWQVTVRRKVGDKEIECGYAGSKEQVACVAKVCASLKPL